MFLLFYFLKISFLKNFLPDKKNHIQIIVEVELKGTVSRDGLLLTFHDANPPGSGAHINMMKYFRKCFDFAKLLKCAKNSAVSMSLTPRCVDTAESKNVFLIFQRFFL